MTDLAASQLPNSAAAELTQAQQGHRRRWLRTGITIFVAAAALGATHAVASYWPAQALPVLRTMLCLSVAALCWHVAVRHRRQWVGPVRHLEELIGEIRRGHAPIDELNAVEGNLRTIAQCMKEMLHDLRHQQQAMSEMNDEVRQRIASRTSALERTIHSLRHQATRDPLTGLYNRRMLDDFLPRLIQQCRTRGVPLALLMIDVDHFKDLNDTLGHAAGDDLLRNLGQLINSVIREGDMSFRCGGDEFVILLPGCDAPAARTKCDSLHALVNGLTKTLKVGRLPHLSIGIACLTDADPPTAESLMRFADQQLYAAKAARGTPAGVR